jgi:PAS domain S-box-containing protein
MMKTMSNWREWSTRGAGKSSVRDQRDRRDADQVAALKAEEAKFRSVAESLSEGLMIFDQHGTVLFHNAASARLHGIEREADGLFRRDRLPAQWRGWDKDGVLLPFDAWPIARVLKGERFENQYLHAECIDTSVTFDALYNGSPIYSPSGEMVMGFITLRDVGEDLRAQRELAGVHDLLRGVIDAIPGVIFAKDLEGRMLLANDKAAEIVGKTRSDVIDRTVAEFMDDAEQAEIFMENDRRIMSTGIAEQLEETLTLPDGTAATWLSIKAPVRNADGAVTGLVGIAVDISAQKSTEADLIRLNTQLESQTDALSAANEQLSESLLQRDLLLREVYHRVKNNMQMVDSFLVLQTRLLDSPEVRSVLTSLRGRVQALGLVHEQLMRAANLKTFDVAPFLQELANNIRDSGGSNGVTISVDAEPFDVELEFAIPLGLLVTELATNSLKHAFPGGIGRIDIGLSRVADGSSILIVADDGVGYEHTGPNGARGGLGSKIIVALVRQLKASMEIQADNGTRVVIQMAPPK